MQLARNEAIEYTRLSAKLAAPEPKAKPAPAKPTRPKTTPTKTKKAPKK